MTKDDNSSPTLRDLFYLLFKHRWTIIIFTFSAVFVAIVYSELYLPKFTAVSKVLIKIGRENTTTENGVLKPSSMITMMQPSAIINSEVELLRGRYIIEQTMELMGDEILNPPQEQPKTLWQKFKKFIKNQIKSLYDILDTFLFKLGLKEKLTPREKTILGLQKSFAFEPIKDSNSIEIKLTYSDPVLTAKIVNTAVAIYLKHHMEIHKTANDLGFFLDQTETFKKNLEDSELRLKDFNSKWNISSLDEQRSLLLKLHSSLRSELDEVDIELAGLTKKVSSTHEKFSENKLSFSGDDITNPSQVIDALKLKLLELKLKKIDLSLKYTDESPLIAAVSEEISDIEKELKKEGIKSAVSIDIAAHEAKKENLNRLINKITKELDKVNRLDFDLRNLTRDINENERLYGTYNQKTEEMRILQAMDTANITNIRVTEPAYIPIQPDRLIRFIPQKIFNIFAAFIIGVFSSITLISIMEMLDHSFKSSFDAEKFLALPVIGTISEKKYLVKKAGFFSRWKN